jgi:XTP/dITP diphosphohydrolase
VTSPRLPAGLLTAAAWDLVRTHPVLTGEESEQAGTLRAAGVPVQVVKPEAERVLAMLAEHRVVVWLAGPGGDQDFARQLGLRLAREPGLAEFELMYGSWDPPGARLLDAVAVMDRLLAPDGDPWKRAQTHRSLAHFLLEEAYEAYDAIAAGDPRALREELGDVLLQVILHAGLAEVATGDEDRFTIDDVAGDLVDKLIRRNPHVFSGATVDGLDQIVENWEQIKRAEKGRGSVMDGVAPAQPALALAAKVLGRAHRAGLAVPVPTAASTADSEERLGETLLAIVAAARQRGLDAEGALRRAALAYADEVRAAEREARPAGP